MVWDPRKEWIFTHLLADEYNLTNNIYSYKQGDARHHIDFNKLNNNPTNIIRIKKNEHMFLHTQMLTKTLHRADIKQKAAEAHKSPEYKEKMSAWAKQPEVKEMLSNRAKEQWKDDEYKKYMAQKFIEFYDSNEDYQKQNSELLNTS